MSVLLELGEEKIFVRTGLTGFLADLVRLPSLKRWPWLLLEKILLPNTVANKCKAG